jgi:signal transduction histidine kinase
LKSRSRAVLILTFLWTTLTVALSSWWLLFTLKGIRSWVSQPLTIEMASRYERMLRLEGGVLIFLLISGGAALLYSLWQVQTERDRVENFFIVFTHELKTSLTRLRLQTELLEETGANQSRVLQLQEDTIRLQVQLENALWMSRGFGDRTFYEKMKLVDFINHLRQDWPSLKINFKADENMYISLDRRLFQNIFQNLIQNALVHAEASEIFLQFEKDASNNLIIQVSDNGKGFSGEVERMGELYSRHTSTSGTGIGLYVVKESIKKLGGSVQFKNESQRFVVDLLIPQTSAEGSELA